jgi:hypothetical protein
MVARAKLSAKKLKALEALLIQPRVAEAAAAAGIAPHVLQRWISTDREFGAAWRAATGATHRQCRRRLGQGYIQAVQSTIQLMYSAPKASTRLKAARDVIALAREANEFAELVAAVADAERLVAAAQAGSLADGKRGKPGIRAHGAKFPRCQEKAVTALLTERSIAGAARAAGISTPTLYRWLKVPAFLARYAAAAEQVFGEGMRWAQMKEGDAVTIIRNLSGDRTIPEETRLQADRYITGDARAQAIEDLDRRTSETEAAAGNAGSMEPGEKWKTLGRNFHQRLKRIRGYLSPPDNPFIRIGCDKEPETSYLIGPGGTVWCSRNEGGGGSEPDPRESA